jgi:hypothetical protein
LAGGDLLTAAGDGCVVGVVLGVVGEVAALAHSAEVVAVVVGGVVVEVGDG